MKILPVKKQNRRKTNAASSPSASQIGALTGAPVRMLLLSLLTGLFLILIHDLLTQNRFWRIQQIQVNGCRQLSRRQVLQQAQINIGDNILAVNLNLIRKRLLAHGWILQARVSRDFPGQLRIAIQEHAAMAQARIQQNYLIDQRGIFFKEMDAQDPSGLPEICGLTHADIAVAGQKAGQALRAALAILEMRKPINRFWPDSRISKIVIDPETGMRVQHQLATGASIYLDLDLRDYRQSYDRLPRILAWLARRPDIPAIAGIDLRNRNRIVIDPIAAPGLDRIPAEKEV